MVNKKNITPVLLLIFLAFPGVSESALDKTHTIEGMDLAKIGFATNKFLTVHDKDTDKRNHIAFTECINTVLARYGNKFRLMHRSDENGEVLVGTYLEELAANGIRIHRLKDLKGKVLRAFISEDLPVLLLGHKVIPKRNVHYANTDVMYLYREPDFNQGNRKLDDDFIFRFKTARGGQVDCREFFEPSMVVDYNAQYNATYNGSGKWISVESQYSGFNEYCVITTRELTLKKIKTKLNNALNDVDFKYQLPEFKRLNGADIDW